MSVKQPKPRKPNTTEAGELACLYGTPWLDYGGREDVIHEKASARLEIRGVAVAGALAGDEISVDKAFEPVGRSAY